MSNLDSAKAAIGGEIAQAKAGRDYYSARVNQLERLLRDLDALAGETHQASVAKNLARHERQAKQIKIKKSGKRLPATGRQFWLDLLDQGKFTNQQLVDAAARKIGLTLSGADRKVLYNRMSVAVSSLVKEGVVKSSGAHNKRVFYKA